MWILHFKSWLAGWPAGFAGLARWLAARWRLAWVRRRVSAGAHYQRIPSYWRRRRVSAGGHYQGIPSYWRRRRVSAGGRYRGFLLRSSSVGPSFFHRSPLPLGSAFRCSRSSAGPSPWLASASVSLLFSRLCPCSSPRVRDSADTKIDACFLPPLRFFASEPNSRTH